MYFRSFLVAALIACISCQGYDNNEDYQQPVQQQRQEQNPEEEGGLGPNKLDPSVPEPPSQIPETSFVCEGKPYEPGMYADEETNCRVYHMCFNSRKEDFICGTGTVFNQETLTCDYPANVDCAASSQFYDSNSEFGKGAPEPGGDNQGQKPVVRNPSPTPNRPTPGGPRPGPGPNRGGGGQQPTYGGSGGGQQPAGGDYDYEQQQPAPAPRPVQRPQAPRPQQPRPQAPRPAPAQRPSKAGQPRTQPRPVAPSYPAPRSKSSPPRQAPAPRPIVQQSEQQNLDYEPTNQQFARRSGWAPQQSAPAAQVSPVSGRRGVASFRPQSQRWQMMAANY